MGRDTHHSLHGKTASYTILTSHSFVVTFVFTLQHILYAHGPFFLDRYGSLGLWSNQGMERSHYQAKAAYFKSTRHGGGTRRSNALHEMFNWFYQVLVGKGRQRLRTKLPLRRKIVKLVSMRRKQGYHQSQARERLGQWLATRQRCGSRWVAQQ